MPIALSVFTVATPELSPEELAAAAEQAGLQGIEWRWKDTPDSVREQAPSYWGNNLSTISQSAGAEELARFRGAAERHGLRSISLAPYIQAGDLLSTEQVLVAAKTAGGGLHPHRRVWL